MVLSKYVVAYAQWRLRIWSASCRDIDNAQKSMDRMVTNWYKPNRVKPFSVRQSRMKTVRMIIVQTQRRYHLPWPRWLSSTTCLLYGSTTYNEDAITPSPARTKDNINPSAASTWGLHHSLSQFTQSPLFFLPHYMTVVHQPTNIQIPRYSQMLPSLLCTARLRKHETPFYHSFRATH